MTSTTLGANVWTIVAHFGFMQKPDVPRILQEANAHPELRHLDLSLANIEIGEEEILVDPEIALVAQALGPGVCLAVEAVGPSPPLLWLAVGSSDVRRLCRH